MKKYSSVLMGELGVWSTVMNETESHIYGVEVDVWCRTIYLLC